MSNQIIRNCDTVQYCPDLAISYAVKNSTDFVHRVRDVHIDQGDQLIRFDVTIDIDVTSLFTQAPVDDALQILKEKLDDRTLEERTSITVAQ